MTILAANWKMHGSMTLIDAVSQVKQQLNQSGHPCLFFPPFPLISLLQQTFVDTPHLCVGAQDLSEHEFGAYTGEVSASILAEQGVQYVLVGHSERRLYHGETDALVARKALRAQTHNIIPIVCMGERLDEREQGRTMTVLATQVQALVDAGIALVAGQLLFAYEPVWAIGTGVAASPEAITEVHHGLRQLLQGLGGKAAGDIAILYGGSVNPSNASEILSLPGVDGALIGGASLKMDQFLAIAECDTVKSV